jgi:mannosyltransferase
MVDGVELIVTNLHRNFTGVSATAAAVARKQSAQFRMKLVGTALPGCPDPVSVTQAINFSRLPALERPHVIWHVRRNNEMRAALFVRNIMQCPIKIVFTSAAQRRHSALPHWLISKMDAVIATTRAAASHVPHVRAIIHHGVDTEHFRPAEDRLQSWLKTGMPGKLGVATIGRIRPEKGTDLFVEAMIALLPLYPDVTAVVIGKAAREHKSFEAALHGRIAAAGLADRFVFTGEIAPDDLPEMVRSLSLLVAPPRYEGFGMTPLEAMASGVPVVATNTGYFSTFIGADEAGILVREPNPVALAQAIDTLLDDPLRRGALNATARERAVAKFSVDNEVTGIARVYEELWRS